MKGKATKRALVSSIVSIVLCVTMLIGTTFAWFTDTASTAVNKIQAGTLEVDIVDEEGNSLDGKSLTWKIADGDTKEQEDILWEPGATYELNSFKIVNDGNLALKYEVQITGITGDAKLLDAIDFTAKVGENAVALDNLNGAIIPADSTPINNESVGSTDLITISGTMKTTAGNEYQGLSIDGIGITVLATQYEYEYDSTTNTYDENAPVFEVTPETAQSVLDSVKDYAVIKLTPGEYGTLYFRQSKQSEPFNSNASGLDSQVFVDGANVTYKYHPGRTDVTYMRTLNNITIEGCNGANVDNIVFMDGNYEYAEDTDNSVSGNTVYTLENTLENHGTDSDWVNKLISFFTVKNLTFKNINFTGNSTVLSMGYKSNDAGLDTWTYRLSIDGLTFDGCTMTVKGKATAESVSDNKMLLYVNVGNATNAIYKNLAVKNCTIDADRVMIVDGVENITVANNTFKNISYRDILLSQGSGTCGIVSGTVIISDNTSDSGSERFVRIGDGTKMNLTITDNTITNYKGSDKNYIKVNGAPVSTTVSGNTITDAIGGRELYIDINGIKYS